MDNSKLLTPSKVFIFESSDDCCLPSRIEKVKPNINPCTFFFETSNDSNCTLCWYVFKAGELNHWKIQKNMNTLLCSGLKVSARSLAWLPSLFNLKSTSKLPTYLLTSASHLTSPHSVWLSPWPPYVYL